MDLLFWYDFDIKKLIVVHIPSREKRIIDEPKKLKRFLETYQLTLEDCGSVRFGEDRLSLFRRMQVAKVPTVEG